MTVRSDQTARRVSKYFVQQLEMIVPSTLNLSRVHSGMLIFVLTDALYTLDRDTSSRPISLSQHLQLRSWEASAIREKISEITTAQTADSLAIQANNLHSDLVSKLSGPLPLSVSSGYGQVRLADYFRGCIIDLIVLAQHCELKVDPLGFNEAVRHLCIALGQRFPGHTIEVRVPPLAATQVAWNTAGPSHSRGTPPNVIELTPTDFFALATGENQWSSLHQNGLISASGAHAKQAEKMFPVVRHALNL